MGEDKFVADNVPMFLKSGVGYNRDAVGWALADVFDHFNLDCVMPSEYHDDNVDDRNFCFEASLFYEYPTDIPSQ